MSRFWLILLGSLVVLGLLVALWPAPPEDSTRRALADLRSCERRVGIPAHTDPTYQAVRQWLYDRYVACMLDLGYTSTTMP